MPMTWSDLRDLVRRGHTIGCHTMTHHALGGHQEEQTLYREIVEAKFVIERSIGTTVRAFCWPFGSLSSYSKEAFDLVRRHYSYGFTTFGAPLLVGGSPYGIDRSPVQASMRLPRVRCAVQGVTELWLAKCQGRSLQTCDVCWGVSCYMWCAGLRTSFREPECVTCCDIGSTQRDLL